MSRIKIAFFIDRSVDEDASAYNSNQQDGLILERVVQNQKQNASTRISGQPKDRVLTIGARERKLRSQRQSA